MWTLRHRCGAVSLMLHDYSRTCAGASASHSVAAGGSNRCRASPAVCQGEVTDRIGSCPGASPAGPCSSETSSPPHTGWTVSRAWPRPRTSTAGSPTTSVPSGRSPLSARLHIDRLFSRLTVRSTSSRRRQRSRSKPAGLPSNRVPGCGLFRGSGGFAELYAVSPLTWSGRVPGRPPSGRGTLIRSRT